MSTRSIDALLRDENGELLSRSTASELSQKLLDEYEQLAASDLSELEHLWREKSWMKDPAWITSLPDKVRQVA